MTPLTYVDSHRDRKWDVLICQGRKGHTLLFNRDRVSLWEDENQFLETGSGDVGDVRTATWAKSV